MVISIRKKPSPIKFPTGSDHRDQSEEEDVLPPRTGHLENPQSAQERQDLRVKLNKLVSKRSSQSTPKLTNKKGPTRNRLRRDPWQPGCAPKCNRDKQPVVNNREHRPFLEGQAPDCKEYPRSQWQQDERGTWFNPGLCSSWDGDEEDEDELGTAESSKENDTKDN